MEQQSRQKYGRHSTGLTFPETMVALAILSVFASLAAPAFTDLLLNQRLVGAAAEYHAHIQWARSHAVEAGRPVTLKVSSGLPTGSCYVIFFGSDSSKCSCGNTPAPCLIETDLLSSVTFSRDSGISVSSTSASGAVSYNSLRGTATPTITVVFSASNGNTIRQVTNLMGRTRTCSPTRAGGNPSC